MSGTNEENALTITQNVEEEKSISPHEQLNFDSVKLF
jgi:hypothetical protein